MLFYFDIQEDGEVTIDRWGIPLPDLDAARAEAAERLGDMARDIVREGSSVQTSIRVRDESGEVVHIASLKMEAGES